MGLFVTIQTDMTNLRGGHQSLNTADHTKTGTKDRHNGKILTGNHRCHTFLNGCFHLDILQRKILQCLVSHQHRDFFHQ